MDMLQTPEDRRHARSLIATAHTSDTVVQATATLIQYLEGHTSKTEVVNHLKSIATPDALKIIPAIEALHETLKTHQNTDLSEVTKVMQGILDQAKLIPKSSPEMADLSPQFSELTKAIQAVENVVREQKLIAEAPVVNVPTPQVNVDAPDLAPLQASIKDVENAIKGIEMPEYKTDNVSVEKLITASNALLKRILEKPVGGGGGGGGRATPYQDINATPIFPTVVQSVDNPLIFGVVMLNPDGTSIGTGGGTTPTTYHFLTEAGDALLAEDGSYLTQE